MRQKRRILLTILLIMVMAVTVIYGIKHRPVPPPMGDELAKLLTLKDNGDYFIRIYFNQAFPKGSNIGEMLAYLDKYADEKTEFTTLDYPSISPNWAYWLNQLTGEIHHSLYLKRPAPSDLPKITWIVEVLHRRGRLVDIRFMPHTPDESFLVWARMQNWGETRQVIRHKRDAQIMEMQPTTKDVRLLGDWLGIKDINVTPGRFLFFSKEENRYKETEKADYLSYSFYYKPHNTEIIPFAGDGISIDFQFDSEGSLIEVSGSPTPYELWGGDINDMIWNILYLLVHWKQYHLDQ